MSAQENHNQGGLEGKLHRSIFPGGLSPASLLAWNRIHGLPVQSQDIGSHLVQHGVRLAFTLGVS